MKRRKIRINKKDLNLFLYIFGGLIFILALILPNIYLDNQIYYESSIIDKYKKELRMYKEVEMIIDNNNFNLEIKKNNES